MLLTFRLNVYDNLFFLPVKIMSKMYSIFMSEINIFISFCLFKQISENTHILFINGTAAYTTRQSARLHR